MSNFLKKLAGIKAQDQMVTSEEEEQAMHAHGHVHGHAHDDEEYEEEEGQEEEVNEDEKEWLDDEYEEGQLSIDVYQTSSALVVKSTIAGVKPDDIDISINNDMLTIRGKRAMETKVRDEDYLYRECYWGNFSRSIILPVEIQAEKIDATLENGVLTITLPKAKTTKQISIKVKEK